MKLLVRGLLIASLSFVSSACAQTDESVDVTKAPLTDEQCMYFAQNGTVSVCHATGSSKNPFKLIRIATPACVNAHSDHAGDFIAVDGDCGPGTCLAEGAPCDATLPCCDELACSDGWCTAPTPTCDSEDFTSFGCSFSIPNGVTVFGGAATLTKTTGSGLFTSLANDENCEYNFGACTSFFTDATTPILTSNELSFTFEFAELTTSFSAGKIYGPYYATSVTFDFYRDGALIASESIDRSGLDCTVGASGSWTPAGGFDRVDVRGNVIGITELEACRN